MVITVRLFAMLRERAKQSSLQLELGPQATVGDALSRLSQMPELTGLIERLQVAVAVNREYVRDDRALHDGDELALIPPVSGGAEGAPHVRITEEPLCIDRLVRRVRDPSAGAIVTFQGTTRDVPQLEYEAYTEMAADRIAAILGHLLERYDLSAIAAEHRVGVVPLGEASVVIAVAAAHREEAFSAARAAIDQIKTEVPIWKRELERWVAGSVVSVGPEAG